MKYAKHSPSTHGHTFAPTHHHQHGSSLVQVKKAAKFKPAGPKKEDPGGAKVTEYPFNKWLDNPNLGYFVLLAIIAALISALMLR